MRAYDAILLAFACGDQDEQVEVSSVTIWDATDGQELLTIRDHPGPCIGVAFSPDGKGLASLSRDGTVILRGTLARRWRYAGLRRVHRPTSTSSRGTSP